MQTSESESRQALIKLSRATLASEVEYEAYNQGGTLNAGNATWPTLLNDADATPTSFDPVSGSIKIESWMPRSQRKRWPRTGVSWQPNRPRKEWITQEVEAVLSPDHDGSENGMKRHS